MAREVKGSIVVRVTDMDVSATVEFNHIKFTIFNIGALLTGKVGMPGC